MGDEPGAIVQLLLYRLLAEHRFQLRRRSGLQGPRMEDGIGFFLHVRPEVIPTLGYFILGKIKPGRDFVGHIVLLVTIKYTPAYKRQGKCFYI
jgi:hypothetical protein